MGKYLKYIDVNYKPKNFINYLAMKSKIDEAISSYIYHARAC
jgi:hypothetical protein